MRPINQRDITDDLELQKHYIVLRQIDPTILELEVNLAISRGWEPLGGVSIMTSGHSSWYTQAMLAKNPLRGGRPEDFYYEKFDLDHLRYQLPEQ